MPLIEIEKFIMFILIKHFFIHLFLKIKYPTLKTFSSSRIGIKSKFEGFNVIYSHSIFNGKLGYYSYIGPNCNIKAIIGRFTSIGPYTKTIIGVHPYTYPFVSTCPAFFSKSQQCGRTFADKNYFEEFKFVDKDNKIHVEIGNDCWIQTDVKIVGGIKIGDGAVIMAGAVVTKNIPPFAIVGGVPAKIIKYRYSSEDIKFLLDYKWWYKDENWLKSNWMKLNDIEELKKTI